MDKKQFVLSVFSLIPDISLTPIQIQKLFFLIEKRIAVRENCEYAKVFEFKPYNYGPFDAGLSKTVTELINHGKIICHNHNRLDHFCLPAQNIIDTDNFLDEQSRGFIPILTKYITSLSFKELCFAIYDEFPDMATNSVLMTNQG